MTKSQAKVKEMIKSDFSALRSIVTHYMVVSKQPLVKLNGCTALQGGPDIFLDFEPDIG